MRLLSFERYSVVETPLNKDGHLSKRLRSLSFAQSALTPMGGMACLGRPFGHTNVF